MNAPALLYTVEVADDPALPSPRRMAPSVCAEGRSSGFNAHACSIPNASAGGVSSGISSCSPLLIILMTRIVVLPAYGRFCDAISHSVTPTLDKARVATEQEVVDIRLETHRTTGTPTPLSSSIWITVQQSGLSRAPVNVGSTRVARFGPVVVLLKQLRRLPGNRSPGTAQAVRMVLGLSTSRVQTDGVSKVEGGGGTRRSTAVPVLATLHCANHRQHTLENPKSEILARSWPVTSTLLDLISRWMT